jgi:hypothetical protein
MRIDGSLNVRRSAARWICVSCYTLVCASGCQEQSSQPRTAREKGVDLGKFDEGTDRRDYGRKIALIIGVNDYRNGLNRLDFAVHDAKAFAELLVDDFGYEPQNVRLLSDAQANRQGILQSLDTWLPSRGLRRGDSMIVFFAGHGEHQRIAGSDAALGQPNTWVTIDEIRQLVERSPCDHRLVILDCCFAGTLFTQTRKVLGERALHDEGTSKEGIPSRSSDGRVMRPTGDSLAYYLTRPAYVGLTAARQQMAVDGLGDDEHSVFTAALIHAMKQRAYSTRSDRAFTFRQLAPLVEEAVGGRLGDQQIPDWGYIEPGAGDFVFVPRERETIAVAIQLPTGLRLGWLTDAGTYRSAAEEGDVLAELETAGRYRFQLRSNDGTAIAYGDLTLGGAELDVLTNLARSEQLKAIVRREEIAEIALGKSVEMFAVVPYDQADGTIRWVTSAGYGELDSPLESALNEGEIVAKLSLRGEAVAIDDSGTEKLLGDSNREVVIARFRGYLLTKEEQIRRDVNRAFAVADTWSQHAYRMAVNGRSGEAIEFLHEAQAKILSYPAGTQHKNIEQFLAQNVQVVHRLRGGR